MPTQGDRAMRLPVRIVCAATALVLPLGEASAQRGMGGMGGMGGGGGFGRTNIGPSPSFNPIGRVIPVPEELTSLPRGAGAGRAATTASGRKARLPGNARIVGSGSSKLDNTGVTRVTSP